MTPEIRSQLEALYAPMEVGNGTARCQVQERQDGTIIVHLPNKVRERHFLHVVEGQLQMVRPGF